LRMVAGRSGKPMKIALIVDNPLRDLPGLVLVGAHLVNAGATVYLVPMNLQQWEVFTLAPDYVLVNYCRKNNQALIERMQAAGIRVGVLDTEGGVLVSLESYGQTLATSAKVRASITSFMTWGPLLGDFAVQSGWFTPDQVTVTGCPRIDFYNESWRDAALDLSDIPGDPSLPLVMFNSNFSLSNPQFYTPKEERTQLIRRFGFSAAEIDEWQEANRSAMEGLTSLANALAERFPQVRFVFRPHPFENLKPYEKLLGPMQNLQLIREGTVDGWVLRSAAVIQRGCSTAIEAAMAGSVAISPSWLPTREVEAVNAVSYSCDTTEEVARLLEQVLSGTFTASQSKRQALAKVVSDWFSSVDGKAAERVALTILAGMPNKRDDSLAMRCARALYGLDAGFRQKVVGTIRRAFRIRADYSFRPWDNKRSDWEGSPKAFGKTYVERIANAVVSASASTAGAGLRQISVVPAAEASTGRLRYPLRSVTLLPQ